MTENDDLSIPLTAPVEKDATIRETWNLLKTERMMTLVPLIVWTSFSLSIFSSLFVPLMINTMPECPVNEKKECAKKNL